MVPVRVLSDEGYGTAMYVIDGDFEDATNKQPLKRMRPVLTVKRPGK